MMPRRLIRLVLGARPPLTEGTLRLQGLDGSVVIRRDRFSIPYIEAGCEADAWFGLGLCQAQDRAFQLEMRLRTARGTLSEVFGPRVLPIDRLARRIGFVESARRQLPALDADVSAQAEAFVRGVNAALASGGARLSPEFGLLRIVPSVWQPEDTLAVGKLVSFLLVGNWDVELSRLKVLTTDGPQALRDLDPAYPDDHPVVTPPGTSAGLAADRLSEDLSRFLGFAGAGGGSNAWVIGGGRTASGRPILANDPHLEPTLPPHWYLARLQTPDWSVAGAAFVGAPAIAVGHNGFAAWGVTAGMVDTTDLFIEEVLPDGRSVRRGDGAEACELRHEVIRVRGRADVTEDVLLTPRGPIIGPALEDGLGAISLRAVWLDAKPVRGSLRAHAARSFEAFHREFAAWPLFSQNLVYADESGAIGWLLAANAPLRKTGWGTLPQPAADPATGWQDEGVPFDRMPYVLNPAAGFVVTANNKPVAEHSGLYLGADWLDGYRAARITEELASRTSWDAPAVRRLQMDELSLAWREARGPILAAPGSTEAARSALDLLRAWDGVVSVDSSAATIYELFLHEIWRRIARSRAPKSHEWALGKGFGPLLSITTFAAGRSSKIIRRLHEQPAGWFQRSWPDEIDDALATVVADLRRRFGVEVQRWGWGRVRPLTLRHPLGVIKPLAPLVNRGPFPWGGDGSTVSQAGGTPLKTLANPLNVASLRMVVEAGAWDEATFALPGGQSGDPLSPHYDDLLPYWRRGEGVPIAWSDVAVARATVSTLTLRPL